MLDQTEHIDWHAHAIEEALAQGVSQGLSQAFSEGYEEGRKQGMLEGQRVLLLYMLKKRFAVQQPLPDWVEAKVSGADNAQMQRWAGRLLTEKHIDTIFDE